MCVPVDSSALTQQLAALVALVQNQVTTPQSSNKSQKRPYAAGTPSKRLQVIDTDGSDPLGYAPGCFDDVSTAVARESKSCKTASQQDGGRSFDKARKAK